MSIGKKHSFIAAFLLVGFSINTLMGFACSVGVDMGYNSRHHAHTDATVADRAHEGKHDHHAVTTTPHSHKQKVAEQEQPCSSKDDCCGDTVRKFEQLDKSVPKPPGLVHPVFLTTFVAAYYHLPLFLQEGVVKDIRQFVRSYHPPIPDIRLAIQSFQI